MCFKLTLFILLISIQSVMGQSSIRFSIKDAKTNQSLTGVTVLQKSNLENVAQSDNNGIAILNNLSIGKDTVVFKYVGFQTQELKLDIATKTIYYISLLPDSKILDDVTIIATTRNNERIENATTKIEVLGIEEMNEESAIKPNSVASILGDISGVQIQQSSASSGNANIRIQGLDGKYTQMLRDGMPLFDGFLEDSEFYLFLR